jgi:hypothetical protein
MHILINTGHPAQVYNFKCLKAALEARGHQIFWTATDKDISKYLLDCFGIRFTTLPRPGKSYLAKVYALIRNVIFVLGFMHKNRIDLAISRVSPYVTLAACLLGKPHIAMTDTETAGIYDTIFSRLASAVLTATSFQRNLCKEQIRFHGNIELFYLHPNLDKPEPKRFSQFLKSCIMIPKRYQVYKDVNYAAYRKIFQTNIRRFALL